MDPVCGLSVEHHLSSGISAPQQPVKAPVKRSSKHLDDSEPVKRPRTAASNGRPVSYKRHPKPPYTYLSMAVVAIHTSPNRRLTLLGVQDSIADMFSFFRGEYRGWRDSIRHNLSSHKCFVRIPRNDSKNAKGSYWTVDLSLVPHNAFNRTSTIGQQKPWAPTLFLQLGIQDIPLPDKKQENQQRSQQPKQNIPHSTTSFSIDSILGNTDTKPLLAAEPPDTKYNHPYSFMGYQDSMQMSNLYSLYTAELHQTANAPHASSLCPLPCYGEPRPFSSLVSDQMAPEPSHIPVATDLSLQQRTQPSVYPDPTSSLQPTSWNLLSQQHPSLQITGSYPTQTSTHTVPTRPQAATTIYRPFETESSSFFHSRTPSTHISDNQLSSSAAYDSDASSDISLPQPSTATYMPPSFPSVYSSDSSDACMGPPSTSLQARPYPWSSDASSCHTYSTTASIGAAVDDLALFSDSSSSSRVSIPIPVFSEDSQTLPNISDVIKDAQVMFYDAVSNSSSSISDVINIFHFGGALSAYSGQ